MDSAPSNPRPTRQEIKKFFHQHGLLPLDLSKVTLVTALSTLSQSPTTGIHTSAHNSAHNSSRNLAMTPTLTPTLTPTARTSHVSVST